MKNFLITIAAFFSLLSLKGQNNIAVELRDFEPYSLKATMEKNASDFLTAMNRAYDQKNSPAKINGISTDAYQNFLKIWAVAPFRCEDADISDRAIGKPGGGFELRNIPVIVPKADEKNRNQEIVLVFNNSGAIVDIYNALPKHIYSDLIPELDTTTDIRYRQIILDFVENFRTAYNRRDIGFLEQVYSNDALIITGRVVKVSNIDGGKTSASKEIVKYTKQTKKEYLTNIRAMFKGSSYININFGDISIARHAKHDNIYGVSLKQEWNQTGYRDNGYLFLIIDFTNDYPMIDVRTWQPEKHGDKKFDLYDFDIP
jgi:hypothetical protein